MSELLPNKRKRLQNCSHSFGDSSTNEDTVRRLKSASILCLIFIIVEVVGGMLSSSLAVLSDAAHLFADLASFIVAIIAARLARLPPNHSNTFGFHRAEALAALYSMSCLWLVSLFLGIEAIHRGYVFLMYQRGESDGATTVVNGKIMSITAAVGVVVNVSLAFILGGDHHHIHHDGHGHSHSNTSHDHSRDHQDEKHVNLNPHSHDHDHVHHEHEETSNLIDEEIQTSYKSISSQQYQQQQQTKKSLDENLNLKAAYLHVLADLLQSLCVFFSGLVIWFNPHWQICDPLITILFCIFVMKTTYGVIFSSISILMNEVPSKVDLDAIYDAIESVDGVSNVHDLHIWSITHGSYSLSVHADADDVGLALGEIQKLCEGFGIGHSTIQLQPTRSDQSCVTCPSVDDK
jgi:zinc transporter 2